ncbi:MAG: hypothetical protein WCG75_08180 [Armatimonadota bacterium]
MIKENFVDIKSFVVPHPRNIIDKLAAQVQVLPGRVAVLCDPHVEQQAGILVAPGKYKGSQDSDSGTVIASGVRTLNVGDRVGFLPMHGLRCSSDEFSWVPEGAEVRLYGVSCPYHESLVVLEG